MALPTPDGVVALDLDLSTLPDEAGIYWLQSYARDIGVSPHTGHQKGTLGCLIQQKLLADLRGGGS